MNTGKTQSALEAQNEQLGKPVTSWRIKNRSVSDPIFSFGEVAFFSEDFARSAFAAGRERAKAHGGSAQLLDPAGKVVESYSHVAEND